MSVAGNHCKCRWLWSQGRWRVRLIIVASDAWWIQGTHWALPSFQMTQSHRDMSPRRVNLNVIQAVPNYLDQSMCAYPFILDKPITPVNKYSLALVIMQRTGGLLRRMCPPWFFNTILLQQRGAFSTAFQPPVWEQKQIIAASRPPAWNIRSQMTSDNMSDVSWPVCARIWRCYLL